MAVPGPEPFYHLQSGIDAAMRIVEIRECAIRSLMWSPFITITAGDRRSKSRQLLGQLRTQPRPRLNPAVLRSKPLQIHAWKVAADIGFGSLARRDAPPLDLRPRAQHR